ncbi:hypothetical protein EX895_002938 [Sporisorium graminicola]|uniref:Uncharacterized protein n=1 Tax=Sporisorium graminicola TaxID=280036 RepID=A0A4U7KXU7_9BASI|nr:hypothetical protein EX895_002938 [Sporisorium graminicola]TKY88228.1 hypothetical protein EX895_002938 [Sporisorium graminicola]
MTLSVDHIDVDPDIIPARVNIHHLQLRDLLQHTGIKDKVLFVSRLQVEQADFTTLKAPSTYCTLDFQPNCLTTGCGLLAAGGQHGELALRPLHSPSSSATSSHLDSSFADRPPAPWLLRTPTGGSINNAITIQHDLNHPSSTSRYSSSHAAASASTSPSKPDLVDTCPEQSYSPWARDEPSSFASSSNVARPGLLFGDHEMEAELSQSVFDELAAAYGFDPSSVHRSSRWRRSPPAPAATSSNPTVPEQIVAPIKVMVSNNDQSIKLYKLRPPKSTPGAGGRIESGLPGLSRNTTLHFSTAINHSSLSPDQRTLISVGDTPEVFIHTVSRSGEHVKLATYTASSDACFSTTWSPDGSKFAVASQDGVVSVWDVRSSRRLAAVSTSQASAGSGAARVAKFSPCGRFLAFTEHRNFWNVTDTVTFQETQSIPAPVAPTAIERSAAADTSSGSVSASASSVIGSEGWLERRLAADERFRLVTGGEEAIARDRERRSMIHATFMREWNRAINLVDRVSESSDNSARSTYVPDWRTNPTSTTPTASIARRQDLLTAALAQSPSSARSETTHVLAHSHSHSHSVNISGLCWDPDAEHIYVSTERVVAKYNVNDTRLAVSNAGLL